MSWRFKQLVWRSIEGLKDMNDITVVSKPVKAPTGIMLPEASGEGGAAVAGGGAMTAEQCLEKHKETLVDKTELLPIGPLKIAKDSYRMFIIVISVMGVVVLLLLVLWLVAFLQASSLRRKLAAAQKKRKSNS